MITLENDFLKAEIALKGAELQRLFSKETDIEYMWNGDANYWAKHSPVLFPIVGSLKNNIYSYKDKEYELPRHGFARDYDFNAKQVSKTEAFFILTFTEETLKNFPFKFELKLSYQLVDRKLVLNYNVKNIDTKKMYFSIGAHPAFAVPNTPDTKYEDYYLAFNEDEKLTYWKLEDGLVSDDTEVIELSRHRLNLKHDLFYNDALVFKSLQSNCISLLNTKNDYGLHFHFDDFPYFGIWAAKDAPFICLEPWCGVADGVNHNQKISHKEGIIKLEAGKNWKRFWEVECF
ncbi:aldose 1-epimerase family protein [Pedobacter aquatilis]|uniref:aldose 1-epimerase family protein n=1 Tax=Pedobacter aquatilis TaxID=351343 RepID=UPI0025B5440A|nr:aldose 1-epimerase family protein [Pedobacter aquatilis]MDN3587820.1 aldose 1-epimerase family protein [Pedobacter aquatilis]